MHSPGARCPHPRVLPNLMAVFLAAIWSAFDTKCSYRYLLNTFREIKFRIRQQPAIQEILFIIFILEALMWVVNLFFKSTLIFWLVSDNYNLYQR